MKPIASRIRPEGYPLLNATDAMLANALRRAREGRDRAVAELEEILAIPSVSALDRHRDDVRRAARWTADRLASAGMSVKLVEGRVHPAVIAEWLGRPGAATLGIYCHYDVQPPDPIGSWTTPPFEPTVIDGNIHGRGATDDKGQLVAAIKAVEHACAAGGPPVNVRFFVDGEEEITCDSLGRYLRANADRLATDYLFVADGQFHAPGVPSIVTSMRGVQQFQVDVTASAHDMHSGLYGGVAPNALNSLVHIFSGLKDREGHIGIPGFYDDIVPPDADEVSSWAAFGFDEEAALAATGAPGLEGERAYSPLERIWARPSLDIHGITGGHMEEGTKTVIPAEATGKASMRLVADQAPERIFAALERHVEALATPGVRATVSDLGHCRPAVFATNHVGVTAAQRAFEASFGRPAVLKRDGSTIPVLCDFQDALDPHVVVSGFGLPTDGLHSPNERFSLDQFHAATEMLLRMMDELGRLARACT